MKKTRRTFIKQGSQITLGMGLLGLAACNGDTKTDGETKSMKDKNNTSTKDLFKISLAQWSLHKAFGIRGDKPTLDNLDFAAKSKSMGFEAIEYVNQFFKDKAKDQSYLKEMNKRAADNGVENLLIMIDREGGLAEPDAKERKTAIENHYKWVEAAKTLGCHSIRVNSFGKGSAEDVKLAAIDGLGSLATYAQPMGINVIVENHGGYSSDGKWLSDVMSQINLSNCGTLPDFGNFCIQREGDNPWEGKCINEYDKYQGVKDLMPFAKAVSAKAFDFDADGNETTIDFKRMMKIVTDAGYNGYVGVEFEGENMDAEKGIIATKALLEKVRSELK